MRTQNEHNRVAIIDQKLCNLSYAGGFAGSVDSMDFYEFLEAVDYAADRKNILKKIGSS